MFDEDAAASLINKYTENLLLEQNLDIYVAEDDNEKEMIRLYHKLENDYRIISENTDELLKSYNEMLFVLREHLGLEEA